jgi:Zn-dependent protease with chaperone function
VDFFQAQENARRRSGLLVFYFAAAVVMIVAVLYVAAVFGMNLAANEEPLPLVWWRPDILAVVAPAALLIIGGGTMFKVALLRGGGPAVARSVGGQRVDASTRDPNLRRLLNVVEEMAIASGVRVPEVFILPEDGINAFAAGWSADDAAIAVTAGAIQRLSRDELQGVIAHEFSHILNGDMRLNVRLIGLLFGILLIAILGRVLVQSLRFVRGGGKKNSGGVILAIFLAGLALLIVGYVGVFFGRLIQSAVSRQREYLADAASVQFTRNPGGIIGALKKIGGNPTGSRVRNAHAAETGHLFFVNALQGSAFNLFSTHPPLADRIRAIDPQFDGQFPTLAAEPAAREATQEQVAAAIRERIAASRKGVRPLIVDSAADSPSGSGASAQTRINNQRPDPFPKGLPPPLRTAQFLTALAALGDAQPEVGAQVIASIPEPLREAAHDPTQAAAVIYALLGAGAPESPANALLPDADRPACERLAPLLDHTPSGARLPLLDLALPSLRALPPAEIGTLLRRIDALIAADQKTTLFEFAVRQVTARHLGAAMPGAAGPGPVIASFAALAGEIATLLSAIARAGSSDEPSAVTAFSAGAAKMPWLTDKIALLGADVLEVQKMSAALERLAQAAPPIKKQLLHALATAAGTDGVIQPAELELLRAVAAALDLPAPPLVAANAP